MMPPMAVGGPTLLTGLCFCSCCGGATTLRTGTSSIGREYRYYTCSTKARQGLHAFAVAAKKRLRNDDGTYTRDHVRAVAQRVEVVSKTEVRIRSLRSELLRTLTAASGVEAPVPGVRGFEPKWRTL